MTFFDYAYILLLNNLFGNNRIVAQKSSFVNGDSMKTEKNILLAFILNFAFSIFEFFEGIFTGSVAILSDAVHDLGDATSIGLAFFLEKKSKREPDENYTYGYGRYSVIGGVITTLILLFGSTMVIYNAILRIMNPTQIHYNEMIIFAVIGVCVNLLAALVTREGNNLNQRAVNLHLLEDVLGWIVVLLGAVVMRFTDFFLLDPLLSIGVALFILINAVKNLKEAFNLFLEKTPKEIDLPKLLAHLCEVEGVVEIHHLHIWSMDGQSHYATMHVVYRGEPQSVKEKVKEELKEHNILHTTLELEAEGEPCREKICHPPLPCPSGHHHHH